MQDIERTSKGEDTCTEKASRAVGVVVLAAFAPAAYGFDVELVSVLATRVPTVACTATTHHDMILNDRRL